MTKQLWRGVSCVVLGVALTSVAWADCFENGKKVACPPVPKPAAPKTAPAPRPAVQPAPQPTYTPRGPSANSAIQPEAQPNSRPVPQPEARRSVQPQSQSVQQSAPRPAAQPAGQAAPQPSSARSPGKSVYTVRSTAVGSKGPTPGSFVLTPSGSRDIVNQVNDSRAGFKGLNARPLPQGTVTTRPDGHINIAASGGRRYEVRPNGTLAGFSRNGTDARFRSDGRLSGVHTANLDVTRGVHGERTVVLRRPDNTLVVRTGPRLGYVQRSVNYHGVSYTQRTFIVGDRVFTRNYVGMRYHGLLLPQYVPAAYFAPNFYGWAYYPWSLPAPYRWGWTASPWYGAYGGYFVVSSVYASPALWLTDFYLGQVISSAYQMQTPAPAADTSFNSPADASPDNSMDASQLTAAVSTPISPELKQAIAEEVRQQLAYENAASQNAVQASELTGLPQVMQVGHLFVDDAPLDVSTLDGQACTLSPGDVVRLTEAPAADAVAANLAVVASRIGDCPMNTPVTLSLDQLQEMQNSFRANLDQGLETLHAQQGKNGLPNAPASALSDLPPPPADVPPPPPATDAPALLDAAAQQADQAESGITQALNATGDAPPPGSR